MAELVRARRLFLGSASTVGEYVTFMGHALRARQSISMRGLAALPTLREQFFCALLFPEAFEAPSIPAWSGISPSVCLVLGYASQNEASHISADPLPSSVRAAIDADLAVIPAAPFYRSGASPHFSQHANVALKAIVQSALHTPKRCVDEAFAAFADIVLDRVYPKDGLAMAPEPLLWRAARFLMGRIFAFHPFDAYQISDTSMEVELEGWYWNEIRTTFESDDRPY